jgi:hypothetical protein
MRVRKGFKHLYWTLGCFAVSNLVAQVAYILADEQPFNSVGANDNSPGPFRVGNLCLAFGALCLSFVFIVKTQNMAYILTMESSLGWVLCCMKVTFALNALTLVLVNTLGSVLKEQEATIWAVGAGASLLLSSVFVAAIVRADRMVEKEVTQVKTMLENFVDERNSLVLVTRLVSNMMWASISLLGVALFTVVGDAQGWFSLPWATIALACLSQVAFSLSMTFAFRALTNFATDQRLAKINVVRKSFMMSNRGKICNDRLSSSVFEDGYV